MPAGCPCSGRIVGWQEQQGEGVDGKANASCKKPWDCYRCATLDRNTPALKFRVLTGNGQ